LKSALRSLCNHRKRYATLDLEVIAEGVLAVVLGDVFGTQLVGKRALEMRLARTAPGGIAGDGDRCVDQHRFPGSRFHVQWSGFKIPGSTFRVQGSSLNPEL